MKIDAVDLFCGAGGLSYGLQKTGITVRGGIDFDASCEFPYKANMNGAKFFLEDITKTNPEKIKKLYRKRSLKLLAGCAPCQPFSNLRNGTNKTKSDKWPLLYEFSRLVSEVNPDFVTMENVPQLKTQSVFVDFVENLKHLGYSVFSQVVDAADYGVPQRRKRLVLLASLHGPIRLLSAGEIGAKRKTVREAIGNLPQLKAGETHFSDPLHKSRALTGINLQRVQASKPGGTWQDWPEHLRLECHKKKSGATFKSVYGRMQWDAPSGTITTQATNLGTGRFGHPSQDRALSLREIAILQSFPRDYVFAEKDGDVEFSPMTRLIGNAVPVELGYAVGRSITQHAKSLKKMVNKHNFKLDVDLNVINHLGVGLYSSTPAALTELVANAWDADANEVKITIDKTTRTITIEDDGHGMTADAIKSKFLNVGYSRRRTPNGKGHMSDSGNRKVMGRKGIGKLSMFALADFVKVTSQASGHDVVGFEVDVPKLKKSLEDRASLELNEFAGEAFPKGEGTRIVLQNVLTGLNTTANYLRVKLARRFSVLT